MANEIVELEVKSNIGELSKDTQAIIEAIKGAKKETKDLSKETEGVGEASKKSVGGIKKLTVGFKTLAKATGFIFLINKAFEIFSEVLGKNQKVVDALDIAMESLSIVFNDLFSFISDNVGNITGWFKDIFENPKEKIKELGTAIKEGLIDRFNQAMEVLGLVAKSFGQIISGDFSAAFDTIKQAGKETVDVFTGVDKSYEKVTGTISNYVTEVVKSAKATVELNKASELAKVQVQGIIEEYDRQAEKLRQIRDDETKTFDERIEANKKLGEVLTEQGVEMQKLVDIQVKAAQVEYDKNKSQENLIVLTEALNEKKAVEAQITGFQSEQLTNQVSLEKELGEVKKEVLLSGLSGMELELAELKTSYEMKLEMARKAGEDTTAITAEYEAQKAEIIKKAAEELEDFKKDLQMKAFQTLGANLDASMNELEGNYSKEKRLAEANGKSTEDIDKKYEAKRQKIAKQQKKFKVAEALITTYQMASLAYKDGLEAGGPAGIVLGPIAAGVATLAGLANVRTILAQDVGGGGGGGGSVSAETQAPAPQMMSGAFDISGGIAPEASRAYVVTDEMSNSQDQLANIRRRATI